MATSVEQIQAELARRQNPTSGGANVEQIQAELARRKAPVKEKESKFEDFGEGIVSSGLSTYYGLKDLVTDVTDEDRARLKDWRDDAGESWAGTAGQVVGELGQLAIPGGAAMKIGGGLSKAMKTIKGQSALAAGLGGAQLPGEESSRLANAALYGGGTAAGMGLLKGAGKLVKGMNKSNAQKRLAVEGRKVDVKPKLSPGQATDSSLAQVGEAVGGVTPFVGKSVVEAQERGIADWGKILVRKTEKELAEVQQKLTGAKGDINLTATGSNRQSMNKLKKAVEKNYDDIWSKADFNTSKAAKDIFPTPTDINTPADTALFEGLAKNIQKSLKKINELDGAAKTKALKDLDLSIVAPANSSQSLRDGVKGLRTNFRSFMKNNTKDSLVQMDKVYPKYKTLRSAVAASRKKGKDFTPDQLFTAGQKIGAQSASADVGIPLQKFADLGKKTVGKDSINIIPNAMKVIGRMGYSPKFAVEAANNALLGQTAAQRGLQYLGGKAGSYADRLRNASGLNARDIAPAYLRNTLRRD